MKTSFTALFAASVIAWPFSADAGDIRVEGTPRVLLRTFDEFAAGPEERLAIWGEGEVPGIVSNGALRIEGNGTVAQVCCLLDGSVANLQRLNVKFRLGADADGENLVAWEVFGASLRFSRREGSWVVELRGAQNEPFRAVNFPPPGTDGWSNLEFTFLDHGSRAKLNVAGQDVGDPLDLGENVEALLVFSSQGTATLALDEIFAASHGLDGVGSSASAAMDSSRRLILLKEIQYELEELRREAGILRMRRLSRQPLRVPRDFPKASESRPRKIDIFTPLENKESVPSEG
jgi:hypothetical protein